MKRVIPFFLLMALSLIKIPVTAGSSPYESCMDCLTSPILFCPPTYFGCPDDNLNPNFTGSPVALPGDINCPSPIVSYHDTLMIDQPCLKKYHRIWTASYPADSASTKLIAHCIQTLYLEDTDAPVLSSCPQDIIVTLNASCDSTATWTPPTATDDCGIASLISNFSPGDTFEDGVTTVIYTAEDICGRQDSCSFTVQIAGVCCLDLTLVCPTDTIVCVSSALDPSETGMALASMPDSTCIDPLIYYTDSLLMANPNCINGSIIERSWFASDSSQTTIYASCTQIIQTEDNSNPVITNLPADITVSSVGAGCEAEVSWSDPVAEDDCGIFAFSSSIPNGAFFPEGVSVVSYAAVDNCANTATASFTVTVECLLVCTTNPIISCPPDIELCPSDSIPGPSVTGLASAQAGDSLCAQPLVTFTDSIVSSGPCPGARHIIRQWQATDPDNPLLSSICEQHIIQKDKTAPVIHNIPSDLTITGDGHHCSVVASWTEPTVSDNCGISSFSSNIPNGTLLSEGNYIIVYTAIDACGQIATSAFTLTVLCENACPIPPSISCPPNYWACPNGGIPSPAESGYATAAPGSSECGTPIVTYSDLIIASGPCPTSKIIQRTWTASDPDNPQLSTSCVQTLSLEDQQPPHILYCPQDIFVNATGSGSYCSTPVSWNSPLAIDNCGAPDLEANDSYGNPINNGQSFNAGTTTVIYTATDDCGNTTNCSFNVTVNCIASCNTPPNIYCPPNKTVCPGSSMSPQYLGYAQATAGPNCPSPNISFSDIIVSSGPCYGEKVINRTWTAGYYSYPGNNSSCVQTIKLKDIQAPHFTYCPPDITVYNTATPVWWNTPQATDNCGSPVVTGSHYPGSYFPVGTTTVSYTAKDDCWNTAYCSFKVTVLNSYNITLNCPNDLYLNCGGAGGAYAYWSPPSYNGNCGNCGSNNQYIPGFVYMGTLNGSEYYCSTGTATWPQAKSICESKGGYLASIGSHQENQFLANILTLQSAWIGLNDAANEGQYKWHSGEDLVYTNWYTGQPNDYNSSQDYVEMLNDGKWNDQYNHYALEFIMEIPCSNIQQTSGPAPGSFLSGGSYTVSYEVQDACGGFGSCSFNIYVSGGLELICPQDITVSAPANGQGVPVSWSVPEASSCCAQCNNPPSQYISGFVYMGSLNGHDYYCSTSVASWPAAKLNCESKGGHLAVINSQQENQFLADLLNLQSAWIGLHDSNTEGSFEWVNGQPLSYTNWYPGQPNNYNNVQDYVEMLNDGQWNDQYNHYALEYIMEIPSCVNISQSSGPVNGSVLLPGSSHTVSYTATDACGNTASCSFDIYVEPVNTTKPYCDSQSGNSFEFHIVSVVFAQLNNSSGNDGGYGDYTNLCATVEEGQSYAMHLTPMVNQQDKNYWRVWIDFNMDGDFYDPNEMVAYGSGVSTISGIISMPPVLWTGQTRMRVVMSPLGFPVDPCGNYQIGETEDYCVNMWGTGTLMPDQVLETRSASAGLLEAADSTADFDALRLYPNPATDFAILEIGNPAVIDKVSLTDVNGQLIRSWKAGQLIPKIRIDFEDISSGIYFIQIQSINGEKTIRKLIVSR